MKLCVGMSLVVALIGGVGCRGKTISAGAFRGAPVIVISIDTLRSDRLPVYGYAKGSTPAIDALAADGIVFERAYSNVPLTLPAHVSMLTGLLPHEHGVRNNIGYRYDPKKHLPISVLLRDAGYQSAAMVSSYVLRGDTGMRQAFDVYDDAIGSEANVALARIQRSGATTLESAKTWLKGKRDASFFLLFHIYEPHGPYEAPEPFRSRHENPYDAEVATADDVVGKLIADLKEKGVYDRSMIILLSDHGEGLGDHGEEEHGVFLYREALQVPMIIKLPDSARRGERVGAPVELTDIAPTIAFAAGVKAPAGTRGVDLLDSRALVADRPLYAETFYPRIHLGWSELRSLIVGSHHYIDAPKAELYDLGADPAERKNVLGDQRRVYAAMRERLSKYESALAAPSVVDAEEAAKLEALGYLGSVKNTEGPLPDPKDHIADFRILQEANRLSVAGRQSEAAAVLRRLLSSNPRFTDAWAELGQLHEKMGQDEEALHAYGEGIKASPASASEFALSMSALHLKANRLDEARKHAELALERNPAGAHELLARISLHSGDLAVAEREIRAAMIDEGAKSRATVTLARIRAAGGRMQEAVQTLEQTRSDAQSRQMRIEQLELTLGDLYAKMDRLPEAEQAFRNEIEAFPTNLTAYSNLGVVLVLQKKYDQIDPLFARMAEKNPWRRAYLVAAETYEVLGDGRAASEWRKRAAGAI